MINVPLREILDTPLFGIRFRQKAPMSEAEGWHPPQREILDLPLIMLSYCLCTRLVYNL